jgi:hypothetical protein
LPFTVEGSGDGGNIKQTVKQQQYALYSAEVFDWLKVSRAVLQRRYLEGV